MHTCREAEADRIPFLGDVEPLANLREGRNFCGHVASSSSTPVCIDCTVHARLLHTGALSLLLERQDQQQSPGMSCCPAEYQHGSEVFRTKIDGLERTYGGIRRARGDGNCFFRRWQIELIRLQMLSTVALRHANIWQQQSGIASGPQPGCCLLQLHVRVHRGSAAEA